MVCVTFAFDITFSLFSRRRTYTQNGSKMRWLFAAAAAFLINLVESNQRKNLDINLWKYEYPPYKKPERFPNNVQDILNSVSVLQIYRNNSYKSPNFFLN